MKFTQFSLQIKILSCLTIFLLCSMPVLSTPQQLEKTPAQTLQDTLSNIRIPPLVYAFAKRGHINSQKEPLLSQQHSVPWDAAGGGRSNDWIAATFGQTEKELIKHLKTIVPPQTWTLANIDQAYQQLATPQPKQSHHKPTFILVKNVGISGLHKVPLGQNAIVQLASQFNYLESPGPYKVSVSDYLDDHTQGPLGAIEAAAAALHRLAAIDSGTLSHALHAVLPKAACKYYKNGYLMLADLPEPQCQQVAEQIRSQIQHLEILPQWVLCESSGAYQLQVFAAAPSFQGAPQPSPNSCAATLATLLVCKQYEAIAKMAVIRSLARDQPVPLHLTLVGQGVFNNPASVMQAALNQVAVIVASYDVQVYVHVFGDNAQSTLKKALTKPNFNIEWMDRKTFQQAPLITPEHHHSSQSDKSQG